VWSGVPQESVLGPTLSLIFINDLDNNISSDVLKFADDTKIYRTVTNQEDGQRLQKDLDTVGTWAVRWQMKFNVEKCKVLHYGRNSIGCQYKMYGQPLAEATAEKDLGVVFSNNLKVVQQCREACSKANQILGLVQRTIAFKNPAVLISLYKSCQTSSRKLFSYMEPALHER